MQIIMLNSHIINLLTLKNATHILFTVKANANILKQIYVHKILSSKNKKKIIKMSFHFEGRTFIKKRKKTLLS